VRVYLHYQDPADRALVDEVADVLETLDYRVSDKRLVTQPSTGDVRFFHAPDRTAAVDVKTIVETFLCSRAGGQTLALLDRRERFQACAPWPGRGLDSGDRFRTTRAISPTVRPLHDIAQRG
jgi:hypothetical protein